MGWINPSRAPRLLEQQLKKGCLLKFHRDLAQSFSEMFQGHLEIGSKHDIKQWSYIIHIFSPIFISKLIHGCIVVPPATFKAGWVICSI